MPSTGSPPSDHRPGGPGPERSELGQVMVFGLLHRDFWASPPGPPLTATFEELELGPTDLHLLQFELQMIFGIDITHAAGVQLTDSVADLLALIERRLADLPASPTG